jgi:hypothetical protein
MVLNDNPAALYYLHAYGVRILAIHILASGRVRGGGGEKRKEKSGDVAATFTLP